MVNAREGFFEAIELFLQPEQRLDAEQLGDNHAHSAAREIADGAWVRNAARGYLTILAEPAVGRHFRLSVLQLGNLLRIGVRVPRDVLNGAYPTDRLTELFLPEVPREVLYSDVDEFLYDWQFQVPDIYASAQSMEDAVARVFLVYETAIQLFTAPNQRH